MSNLLDAGIDPSNMSDEDIRMLMELGIIPDEQSGLDKQLELANELRWQEGPEGRYTSNGRMYTAANPLEFLGQAGQQWAAQKQQKDIQAQMEANRQAQAAARAQMAQKLRGPQAQPTAPIQPPAQQYV